MPISSQLRSHRLFSENWERLAYLVDAATLYHTGLGPASAQLLQLLLRTFVCRHEGVAGAAGFLYIESLYDKCNLII